VISDLILILVVLLTLKVLASSRLGACIRTVAAQGILLGLLPMAASQHPVAARVALLAVGSILLKGVVFPRLLFRALRDADVNREVEPYVGYVSSLLLGLVALMGSFWISARLPLPSAVPSNLLVPVAFFSIFAGLFVIIGRKRAVNQVLGFIVLENGIFAFGIGVMEETSLLVELGVLLDVFVAVFVMGIMIFHINREFDHIETDRLTALKD
jgi:hydrogenase-4 component E